MDQASAENLARIVALELNDVSEADAAFLRARASYLTRDQREKFAAILEDAAAEADEKPKKPAK
jgi:hypothetical protein